MMPLHDFFADARGTRCKVSTCFLQGGCRVWNVEGKGLLKFGVVEDLMD